MTEWQRAWSHLRAKSAYARRDKRALKKLSHRKARRAARRLPAEELDASKREKMYLDGWEVD